MPLTECLHIPARTPGRACGLPKYSYLEIRHLVVPLHKNLLQGAVPLLQHLHGLLVLLLAQLERAHRAVELLRRYHHRVALLKVPEKVVQRDDLVQRLQGLEGLEGEAVPGGGRGRPTEGHAGLLRVVVELVVVRVVATVVGRVRGGAT